MDAHSIFGGDDMFGRLEGIPSYYTGVCGYVYGDK